MAHCQNVHEVEHFKGCHLRFGHFVSLFGLKLQGLLGSRTHSCIKFFIKLFMNSKASFGMRECKVGNFKWFSSPRVSDLHLEALDSIKRAGCVTLGKLGEFSNQLGKLARVFPTF